MFTLSNFIWNIEVVGNNKISKDEIRIPVELPRTCTDIMYHLLVKVAFNALSTGTMAKMGRVFGNWIGIEIQGTNAIVKIVEADMKPEIIQEDEYCNIVATKDAMIVKVNAQNGVPVVKEGDVVTKGTVLIEGWLEGQYTGIRYVHANGEVQAKVWYTKNKKIPYILTQTRETGNQENKYSLKINNFEINLSKGVPKFQNYDTIETSKKLKLFSDFYLPIEINTKTYQEYENKEFEYTLEEAKEVAIQKAKQSLENQIKEKKLINQKVNVEQTETDVEVEVIYEVLESIGTKEKIVF